MKILYLSIIFVIIIFFVYLVVQKIVILDTSKMDKELFLAQQLIKNNKIEKMNIAIVTLETRKLDLLPYHNNNVRKYCIQHGYTYIFLDKYENDLKLPIYWKKIQLIQDVLKDGKYDYVMWMDSDTMICKKNIPIEYILSLGNNKSIFIGQDFPRMGTHYNAGVFIIKNNIVGNRFISDCIKRFLSREKCQDNGEYKLLGAWSGECYEQGIMNELLKEEYVNYVHTLEDFCLVNSSRPYTSTIILHLFSGTSKNKDYTSSVFREIDNDKEYNTTILSYVREWLNL